MAELIITGDGSHTLFVPGLNEHYHSIHGAVRESEHIFIRAGFDQCSADPVNIFEAGFGTGLNALLTAVRSAGQSRDVYYTSIEKFPVNSDIIRMLNYPDFAGNDGPEIFRLIHSSPWGEMRRICRNFSLMKVSGDLLTEKLTGVYDLIYFDAFGPDKQPEMWSSGIFEKISSVTRKGGMLLTYSSKGDVKRNLRSADFEVTVHPGPPGKRHFVRAIRI